eukprot:CAMPEP_0204843856 /NCGR_PEP_ID=MMETSP1346-20131115/48226_1 /ASSEMBLY_ACC=CAM_ASM_000771 /TAXON_ID=215587 /ORGANISM="Aplanochytrium stocchinoi, Strain GSBS06" /LENGTH=284 /DNA_ID=CAMNT_0051983077 /DNA_START=205 /DNA_END=1056 /DNA_ORIENTATION=+
MKTSKSKLRPNYDPKLYALEEAEKAKYDPQNFKRTHAGKIKTFRSKHETVPVHNRNTHSGNIRTRQEISFRDYQSSFSYGSFYKNSKGQNAWLQEVRYQRIVGDKLKKNQSKEEVDAALKEWHKQRWGTTRALLRDSMRVVQNENDSAGNRAQGQGVSFEAWMKTYDKKRKAATKTKRMKKRKEIKTSKELKNEKEKKLKERESQWLQEKLERTRIENMRREREKTEKLEKEQIQNREKSVKAKEAMKKWLLRKQHEAMRKRQTEQRKDILMKEVREEERKRKW